MEPIKNLHEKLLNRLDGFRLKPNAQVLEKLNGLGTPRSKNPTSLAQLLRRPEILFEDLSIFDPTLCGVEEAIAEDVKTRVK